MHSRLTPHAINATKRAGTGGEGVRGEQIVETLSDSDHVRRSARFASAKLFSRWYNDMRGGKHVVVVVVSEPDPRGEGD
jgi:hypothetical protein